MKFSDYFDKDASLFFADLLASLPSGKATFENPDPRPVFEPTSQGPQPWVNYVTAAMLIGIDAKEWPKYVDLSKDQVVTLWKTNPNLHLEVKR